MLCKERHRSCLGDWFETCLTGSAALGWAAGNRCRVSRKRLTAAVGQQSAWPRHPHKQSSRRELSQTAPQPQGPTVAPLTCAGKGREFAGEGALDSAASMDSDVALVPTAPPMHVSLHAVRSGQGDLLSLETPMWLPDSHAAACRSCEKPFQ